jgi:hypothetical protein
MRRLTSLHLVLPLLAACGGTSLQPAMPDLSTVDRSAEELGLPEPRGEASAPDPAAPEAAPEDGEATEEDDEAPSGAAVAPPPRIVRVDDEALSSPRLRLAVVGCRGGVRRVAVSAPAVPSGPAAHRIRLILQGAPPALTDGPGHFRVGAAGGIRAELLDATDAVLQSADLEEPVDAGCER